MLSSSQLEAFMAVAREGGFSAAARKLNVTQPALSQRIQNLEFDLGLTLFLREPSGVKLTEAAHKLLRLCQARESLENEFMAEIKAGPAGELAGVLRIAAFSSVMRSVIVPALSPLLRRHLKVKTEFMIREIREMPSMLQSAQADYIVTDTPLESALVESHFLGEELYVAIESTRAGARDDLYFDHDPSDPATAAFFRFQKLKVQYQRGYMGDVYGIMEGVAQGLGRAVMSRHLLESEPGIRVIKKFKPMPVKVYLQYYKQPFYSKLHGAVVAALERECAPLLRVSP